MAYHSREGRPPRTMEVGLDRFSRQSVLGWVHGEDAPWTGGIIPQNKVRSHVSGSQLQDPVYSTYGYRDPAPSEADTIAQGGVPPSDSGYATQTHFDNVSLYSQPVDRSQEIQSLVRQMDDLGNINLVQGVGSGLPQSPISAHPIADKGLICPFPGCKKPFCKTRSELNKHDARHSKPHKCDIAGCNRVEGFSTPNDLARHKQSVHGVDGIKYVCNEGQCRGKEKLWPRADNFRAHLDRMHQIKVAADDLDRFVYKEPSSISSQDVMYLSSLGAPYDPATLPHMFPGDMSPISPDKSQDDGSSLDLGTDAQPRNYDMSVSEEASRDVYGPSGNIGLNSMSSSVPRDSPAQQLPEFVRPNMLSSPMTIDSSARPSPSRTSELGVPPPEGRSVESIDLTSDESMRDDSSDVPSVATMEEGRSSSISFGNESSACGESIAKESRGILASLVDDDLESADLSDDRAAKLVEKLEKIGILEKLGYKQTKQASSAPEPKVTLKKPASNPSSENQLSFSCPECHKAFARNCELKKHKKRHDKPYGCTFRNCRKTFGSKNDWKRHENSQHFQLEVWKCDYHPPSTDVACGKVSHRRETFRSHLQRDHSLQDFEIEKRLDSCRIGRNCEGAFWCGFCRKRVPLLKKGQEGWNERFDHIDSHFFGRSGRKMDIGEWEDIDPDQKRLDEDGGESDSDAGAPPGTRRKRAHDGEPDAEEVERQRRPRHHRNGQPVTLVTCCRCTIMQCDLRLAKTCPDDGHQFCANCQKETAWVN